MCNFTKRVGEWMVRRFSLFGYRNVATKIPKSRKILVDDLFAPLNHQSYPLPKF